MSISFLWQDSCLFLGMENLFLSLQKTAIMAVFFITATLSAQDYSQVDQLVSNYPKFSGAGELAEKINKDFIKEDEKARAIFYWIANNIKYDVKTFYAQKNNRPVAFSFRTPEEKEAKQRQFKLDFALNAFKSKKAVCQGYTALFDHLSELTGLESVTVTGTAKTNVTQIGKLPGASDHAWNAVKINGHWKLVEPTWASGVVDPAKRVFTPKFNDGYFFTPPDVFVFTHFPDNKKWLLGEFTEQEFASYPLYFGEYIRDDYTILAPKSGIFTGKKYNTITFKIQNLNPEDQITYAFSRFKKIELPELKVNGDMTEFNVFLPDNSNGYLTVYINNKGIVAYKIQR